MEIDSDKLNKALDEAVATGAVPGAVVLVADGTRTRYERAAGTHSILTGEAMRADSVFRIASMTKLATVIALLQLVERGELPLETPVGDVLPAFDALPVLDGFDGDSPVLRPAASRATVRHLVTHTSGLAYPAWNAALARYSELTGVPWLGSGSLAAFDMPLVCDPGTAFHYGMSMDWAGRLIEAVGGQALPDRFAEHVFGPLGMTGTTFVRTPEQLARSGAVHLRTGDGWIALPAADYYLPGVTAPEFYAGGHALYSTPVDYLRMQQALLRDGEPVLRPATVANLFRPQLGDLDVGIIPSVDPVASADLDLRGMDWGLGIMLNTGAGPIGLPPGTGGWTGGFNTFYWVDRANGFTAALYTQTLPFWDPAVMQLYADVEATLYPDLPPRTFRPPAADGA
jgi:methyl acetate hydrolase